MYLFPSSYMIANMIAKTRTVGLFERKDRKYPLKQIDKLKKDMFTTRFRIIGLPPIFIWKKPFYCVRFNIQKENHGITVFVSY